MRNNSVNYYKNGKNLTPIDRENECFSFYNTNNDNTNNDNTYIINFDCFLSNSRKKTTE